MSDDASPVDESEQAVQDGASGGARHASVRVGARIALVSAPTFAVLDPANGPLAERLWAMIERGGGIDELLDALSTTGLSALGDFALAQIEEGAVRFVVRGAGVATVGTDHRLDAAGRRTWVEDRIEGCTRFTIAIGDDPGTAPLPFRVASAIVPADAIRWPADPVAGLAEVDVAAAAVAALDDLGVADDDDDDAGPAAVDAAIDDGSEDAIPDTDDGSGEAGSNGGASPAATDGSPLTAAPPPPPPPPSAHVPPHPDGPATTLPPGAALAAATHDEGTPSPAPGAPDEYDYDSLYGLTVAKSVEGAAVHDTDAPGMISDVPGDVPALEGDHDGMTMSLAELRAMQARAKGGAPPPDPATGVAGPVVQAYICHLGHPNPPSRTACRRCGAPLTPDLVSVARPPLGRITLSSGDVVELDRPAIVGRNPRMDGPLVSEMPRLVKLDVGQGLSRSHVMIRIEGWQVLVEDLGSANGTTITVPGSPPRRLRAGEAALLEHGTHIDLGGEVVGTYDAEG